MLPLQSQGHLPGPGLPPAAAPAPAWERMPQLPGPGSP